MTSHRPRFVFIALLAALGGCAVTPTGPNVMVLPGDGMSFDQFRGDDVMCRQYALDQIGGATADQAAQQSAATSAAVGAVVGALAGAAIGGNSRGAAVGAGGGILLGSAMGVDSASASRGGAQRQYDNAYIQCMYARGHRVPVPAGLSYQRPGGYQQRPVSAAEAGIPPPPPGNPPEPPPR